MTSENDAELKKIILAVAQEKKKAELKQLEYEAMKQTASLKEVPFKSTSDIGEGFDNLDNNSHLDMNSRLSSVEISACTIIDQLKAMGVFPVQATITQQFKRLKVSEGGKGRTEKVQIVTGHREQQRPVGFMDLFKKREKQVTDGQPTGN